MNKKRFLIACVVVYVVYQVLAFLVHQIWLGDTYLALADVWRPSAELLEKQWIMFVTSAVWVLFFCYIFVRGFENRGLAEGARYGAVIGLFYAIPQAYDSYAILPIPYGLALKWFVSGLVMSIVLGLILASIYRPAE